ncbi:MAG TPA: hypothetical protein VFW22_06900 [Pseudolabrys sp.]|nr:hypothetical protein [Pseudolabrys sp.]
MPAKRSAKPAKRKPAAKLSKPAADLSMTAEQAARLKQLSIDAYELDAFKQVLTRAEAARRITTLSAKLKLLDEPPHTL